MSVPSNNVKYRSFKVLCDPELHAGILKKQIRYDGIVLDSNTGAKEFIKPPKDPRNPPKSNHVITRREAAILPLPKFKFDEYYIGTPLDKEVTFTNLNDNMQTKNLHEMCNSFGSIEETKIYYHHKTKKHLGIGKVVFHSTRAASECALRLNNTSKMGNRICVFVDSMGQSRQKIIQATLRTENQLAQEKARENVGRLQNAHIPVGLNPYLHAGPRGVYHPRAVATGSVQPVQVSSNGSTSHSTSSDVGWQSLSGSNEHAASMLNPLSITTMAPTAQTIGCIESQAAVRDRRDSSLSSGGGMESSSMQPMPEEEDLELRIQKLLKGTSLQKSNSHSEPPPPSLPPPPVLDDEAPFCVTHSFSDQDSLEPSAISPPSPTDEDLNCNMFISSASTVPPPHHQMPFSRPQRSQSLLPPLPSHPPPPPPPLPPQFYEQPLPSLVGPSGGSLGLLPPGPPESYQSLEHSASSLDDEAVEHVFRLSMEAVVSELHEIMRRDVTRRMVETVAFRAFDEWWDRRTAVKSAGKRPSHALKMESVNTPLVNKAASSSGSLNTASSESATVSSAVTTGGQSSLIASLFGENRDLKGGLTSLLGGLRGSALPRIQRKRVVTPPPRDRLDRAAAAAVAAAAVDADRGDDYSVEKGVPRQVEQTTDDDLGRPHTPQEVVKEDMRAAKLEVPKSTTRAQQLASTDESSDDSDSSEFLSHQLLKDQHLSKEKSSTSELDSSTSSDEQQEHEMASKDKSFSENSEVASLDRNCDVKRVKDATTVGRIRARAAAQHQMLRGRGRGRRQHTKTLSNRRRPRGPHQVIAAPESDEEADRDSVLPTHASNDESSCTQASDDDSRIALPKDERVKKPPRCSSDLNSSSTSSTSSSSSESSSTDSSGSSDTDSDSEPSVRKWTPQKRHAPISTSSARQNTSAALAFRKTRGRLSSDEEGGAQMAQKVNAAVFDKVLSASEVKSAEDSSLPVDDVVLRHERCATPPAPSYPADEPHLPRVSGWAPRRTELYRWPAQILVEHNYFFPPPATASPRKRPATTPISAGGSRELAELLNNATAISNFSKPKRSRLDFISPKDVGPRATQVRSTKAVTFAPRSAIAERRNLLSLFEVGLSAEDASALRCAYHALLQAEETSVGTTWLNDTHWVDHAITASPPPKTARLSAACRLRRKTAAETQTAARVLGNYERGSNHKQNLTGSGAVSDKGKRGPRGARSIGDGAGGASGVGSEVSYLAPTDPAAGSRVTQSQTISREARSEQRRIASYFAADMETTSDLLKFNQLKFRKKQLTFGRSSIHSWGLFALEPVAAEEMVVEYVGQVVRKGVAETRERQYEKQGVGSSYLFRIDDEYVIDATRQGNKARFINHSCQPNCFAKVVTVEGKKKIVIYSKRDIAAFEEITYDYKFPYEEEKIPCLCGAPQCRQTLN